MRLIIFIFVISLNLQGFMAMADDTNANSLDELLGQVKAVGEVVGDCIGPRGRCHRVTRSREEKSGHIALHRLPERWCCISP